MRPLSLALIREGSTNTQFLSGVLFRLVEDICRCDAPKEIDTRQVLDIKPGKRDNEGQAEAAYEARESYDILFIHADADGNANQAREKIIDPVS